MCAFWGQPWVSSPAKTAVNRVPREGGGDPRLQGLRAGREVRIPGVLAAWAPSERASPGNRGVNRGVVGWMSSQFGTFNRYWVVPWFPGTGRNRSLRIEVLRGVPVLPIAELATRKKD